MYYFIIFFIYKQNKCVSIILIYRRNRVFSIPVTDFSQHCFKVFCSKTAEKRHFVLFRSFRKKKSISRKQRKKIRSTVADCGLKKVFLTYFFDHDIIYADFAVRIAVVKVQRAIMEIFGCPELSGGEVIFAVGTDTACKHDIAFKLPFF